MASRSVFVPAQRLPRWMENFGTRHGSIELAVVEDRLTARAEDGSVAEAALPFDRAYDGGPDAAAFADAVEIPSSWGLLLVRKGGFGIARLGGSRVLESKIGQRHVQGRTKAGGQSQQRFARRRDNQARQAYEAAAGHAHRILVEGGHRLEALVCGGDRPAVEAVLSQARLSRVAAVRTGPWLPVADPRRAVLDAAVVDACSVLVTLHEAD
ncbi:MAG: acVLRF1 family peptidyl-tRNA hydrolase [Nocardioides sp.]